MEVLAIKEEHIVKVLARVDEPSPLQGRKENIHLEDDVADREQKTDFTRLDVVGGALAIGR